MNEADASATTMPSAARVSPKNEEPWQPYEKAPCELQCLPVVPRWLYKARWAIMNYSPLCWRLPVALPFMNGPVSYGEALLGLVVVLDLVLVPLGWSQGWSPMSGLESSGSLAAKLLVPVFLFATHNNVVLILLLGLPFERALFWHWAAAIVALNHSAFHAMEHYVNGDEGGHDRRRHLLGDDGAALSGWVFLGTLIGMIVCSASIVRRHLFQWFYHVHVTGAVVVVIGALLHEAGVVMGGAGLWAADWTLRLVLMYQLRSSQDATLKVVDRPQGASGDVVELTVPSSRYRRTYAPGQWVFVCIPRLGPLHWHPFTIASSSEDDEFKLVFKAVGPWTKAAAKLAKQEGSRQVYLEGPYGAPMVDMYGDHFKCVVLVSAGMGMTFSRSYKHQILHDVKRGRPLHFLQSIISAKARDLDLYDHIGAFGPLQGTALPSGVEIWEDLFVTGGGKGAKPEAPQTGDVEAGGIRTPLSNRHLGRPDFNALLQAAGRKAAGHGERRVAVCVCGPEAVVKSVRLACLAQNNKDVNFELHWETFEF